MIANTNKQFNLIEVRETVAIPVAESGINRILPDGIRLTMVNGVPHYSASDVAAYHRRRGRDAFADSLEQAIAEVLA